MELIQIWECFKIIFWYKIILRCKNCYLNSNFWADNSFQVSTILIETIIIKTFIFIIRTLTFTDFSFLLPSHSSSSVRTTCKIVHFVKHFLVLLQTRDRIDWSCIWDIEIFVVLVEKEMSYDVWSNLQWQKQIFQLTTITGSHKLKRYDEIWNNFIFTLHNNWVWKNLNLIPLTLFLNFLQCPQVIS